MAILAVVAHAACAPLNPAYSAREFEFYFRRCAPRRCSCPMGRLLPRSPPRKSSIMRILYLLPETTSPAGIFSLMNDGECGAKRASWAGSGKRSGAVAIHVRHDSASQARAIDTSTALRFRRRILCSALQLEPRDRCLGVMPLFHIHGLSTFFAASYPAEAMSACLASPPKASSPAWRASPDLVFGLPGHPPRHS